MTSHRFSFILAFVFLALACLSSSQAVAAEQQLTTSNSWRWLDERRNRISRSVTALGRNLDAWLAGGSIGDFGNESYLRLRINQQFSSRGDLHSRMRVGGSLDLPRATDRWKFIFESDSRELNSLEDTVLGEEPSGNSVAGFRFLQRAADKIQLSHSVGLRGRLPLDPYYRLRANADQQLSEHWGLGLRQRIWHYNSEGWGYNTNVSLRRTLNPDQLLHIASDIRFQQSRAQIEFGQTVALHNSLSAERTLSYELGVFGVNKPNRRVDLYYVGAQYRQAIREDWLFLEVVPQLLMERVENWKPRPRLSINLEILFFDF